LKRRLVLMFEWLTWCPVWGVLPQCSHFLDMLSSKETLRKDVFFTRRSPKKQLFFSSPSFSAAATLTKAGVHL
jgi:hypothetical protein